MDMPDAPRPATACQVSALPDLTLCPMRDRGGRDMRDMTWPGVGLGFGSSRLGFARCRALCLCLCSPALLPLLGFRALATSPARPVQAGTTTLERCKTAGWGVDGQGDRVASEPSMPPPVGPFGRQGHDRSAPPCHACVTWQHVAVHISNTTLSLLSVVDITCNQPATRPWLPDDSPPRSLPAQRLQPSSPMVASSSSSFYHTIISRDV